MDITVQTAVNTASTAVSSDASSDAAQAAQAAPQIGGEGDPSPDLAVIASVLLAHSAVTIVAAWRFGRSLPGDRVRSAPLTATPRASLTHSARSDLLGTSSGASSHRGPS